MEIKANLSNPIQLHFSSAEAIFYWRRAHEWGGENNKAFLVAMKLRNWARKRNGEGWEERKEEKWRMKEKDRKRERKRNGEGKNERERKKVRKRDWGSKRAFSFFPFSRVRRSVFYDFFPKDKKLCSSIDLLAWTVSRSCRKVLSRRKRDILGSWERSTFGNSCESGSKSAGDEVELFYFQKFRAKLMEWNFFIVFSFNCQTKYIVCQLMLLLRMISIFFLHGNAR